MGVGAGGKISRMLPIQQVGIQIAARSVVGQNLGHNVADARDNGRHARFRDFTGGQFGCVQVG